MLCIGNGTAHRYVLHVKPKIVEHKAIMLHESKANMEHFYSFNGPLEDFDTELRPCARGRGLTSAEFCVPFMPRVTSMRAGGKIGIRLLKQLEIGEYTSTELADLLGEKFNSVDHAAKRLKKAGKVDKSSEGKWFLYST